DELYITANVDETDLGDVEKGKKVDVKIDGQDSKMKGKVEQVGKATASSFSLMPSSNSDGNYTKVSQVVPVKISLESAPAKSV
ncbi:HlyD family efflux transporter periplasmic adaptor subunit, partial [Staphylococcus aureus]